jgi:hypothetical protein
MAIGGLVNRRLLEEEIRNAVSKMGPEAVHVDYRFGEDHTGDPSLFFRVVLKDEATDESVIGDVTRRISATIFNVRQPIENWGLHPYINYRSESEHRNRPDPKWGLNALSR